MPPYPLATLRMPLGRSRKVVALLSAPATAAARLHARGVLLTVNDCFVSRLREVREIGWL